MRLLFLSVVLAACASKPPAPEPEILPCYKAKTFKEFSSFEKQRAKKPNAPVTIAGKKYACVETALAVEPGCYMAKTAKQYAKLSREQEKRPAWPVKADGRYYRCIQRYEEKK